jgi:hypothetical protein
VIGNSLAESAGVADFKGAIEALATFARDPDTCTFRQEVARVFPQQVHRYTNTAVPQRSQVALVPKVTARMTKLRQYASTDSLQPSAGQVRSMT